VLLAESPLPVVLGLSVWMSEVGVSNVKVVRNIVLYLPDGFGAEFVNVFSGCRVEC